MAFVDILTALLIIAAITLTVYIIFFLKRLNRSVELLQKDVHDLIEQTIPVIENLNDVSEKLNSVVEITETQITEISGSINSVREKFSFLVPSPKPKKSKRFEGPLSELTTFLSSFVRGFFQSWNNSRKN